jgi:ER lumen protein retaining receptor
MGDDFPHLKVLIPAALVLTCIVQSGWTAWELTWSFSLWLEALAFLPQIVMLNKIRIVENITSHYVAALGLYRFFYILNWIYKWQVDGFYCWTQILAGSL